jgi:signal transduction histidine kinase
MLICLCNSSLVQGQTESTEALIQKAYSATNDKEKLDAMLEACQRNDIDTETFNELAFMSQPLAKKSGDIKKIGLSVYYIAWAHYLNSYNDSARMVIDEMLPQLQFDNPQHADVIFKLQSFKATTYQSEQNNAEALRILYPLLEEVQKFNNNVHIAQTMHLIAIVEGQQKNPQKSIEWEKQALPLLQQNNANENNVRSTILATIAKAYIQLHEADSALVYNDMAIRNFRETDDLYNLAIALQRQAKIFTEQNNLIEAKKILDELTVLNEKIHMGDGDMNYWMAFIHYHIQAKEYDVAIRLIQERLSHAGTSADRSATKWGVRFAYYEALAQCYEATGNSESYASIMKEMLVAKDSLYSINSAEEIADLQTKYEVQKKENTIIEQELALSRKNAILISALLSFILIAVIIWIYFRNASRRKELRMHLQMQEDKMKAEQAVREAEENERKRIAADLHDNLGSYAASIISNIQHLEHTTANESTLHALKGNSQAMVSTLSDTIWALKKDKMMLTAISDRVKLLLLRLVPSYPEIELEVKEQIENDLVLQPSQAYQLFSIIHEAVNNALKHSKANRIIVRIECSKTKLAEVTIEDNGVGSTTNIASIESGNGVYNMKRRAEILGWDIVWKQNEDGGIVVEIKQNNSL